MGKSGEALFEEFCSSVGLDCSRIEEASELSEQRPDYRVKCADGSRFIAEVKLLAPTPEEESEIRRLRAGEVVVSGGAPGQRMRRLIKKANAQLKALANERVPRVLFVFNPEFHLRRHTDPYAILTAMRGLDVVPVHVPEDPGEQPRFGEIRSGPGKQMTEEANTSTSAIICPHLVAEKGWRADVFHNRFASFPLPVSGLVGPQFRHLHIRDDERDWSLA